MKELTQERIAEWHPDWELVPEGHWVSLHDYHYKWSYKGKRPSALPHWLSPDSNDWVELLEALPSHWRIEFTEWHIKAGDMQRCVICEYLTVQGTGLGPTRREAFLAALAQLIDAKEGE